MFLFCCFTGLAFIDLYNLKEENIKTFFDDGEWIVIHRQKTGTEANIKLLDYPKQIMEKYRASHLAHELPYDGYGDLSHQRSSDIDGEFDTGTQEY